MSLSEEENDWFRGNALGREGRRDGHVRHSLVFIQIHTFKKKRDYEQKGKLKVAFFTLGRDSIVHANAMSESPVEGMGKGELEEREGATVLLDDFAVIVLSFAFVHHHFSHLHNFLAPTL